MIETRNLSEIVIGERRRALRNIENLSKSIEAVGLLHPVVILPDNSLIAGQRRLEAFKLLGRSEIPVTVAHDIDTLQKALKAECDENTCREDFTPEEAIAKGLELEEVTRELARKALEEGRIKGGGDRRNQQAKIALGEIPPERSAPAKPRDEGARATAMAAHAVGMDRRTYEKAKEVIASADEKLIEKMNRSGKVNGAYKILRNKRAVEEISKEPPPLPRGPFRVIVIDPPWDYSLRKDDPSHRSSNPYPSMSLDEIKAFPVQSLAHDDCILWLWTTNSFLPIAWQVVDAWGFEYKTMLTWVKDHFGTGDWLRGQTEHCLLCLRGRPTIILTDQSTVIHGPLRKHSEKPDEFYAMVEALCPGSKVDIFRRKAREGWIGYGNE